MSAASSLSGGTLATPGFWAYGSTSNHSVTSIWGQYSSDRGTKFIPPGSDSVDIPRTSSPSHTEHLASQVRQSLHPPYDSELSVRNYTGMLPTRAIAAFERRWSGRSDGGRPATGRGCVRWAPRSRVVPPMAAHGGRRGERPLLLILPLASPSWSVLPTSGPRTQRCFPLRHTWRGPMLT